MTTENITNPVTSINGPGTSSGETMTGSWVRLLAENKSRTLLLLANVGDNNVGIYFAALGNANTPPVPTGIGEEGVFTMVPSGTYAPPPVPLGEVWAIGTISDVVTAYEG